MEEVPDPLPRQTIAVVRTPKHLKWAVFECPCGHRHRIMLNLDQRRDPAWTLTQTDPPSFHPSVDSRGHRRCHFWLRRGRIYWVPARAGSS